MIAYAPWLVWIIPFASAVLIPVFGRINGKVRDAFAVIASGVTMIVAFSMILDVFSNPAASTYYDIAWIPFLGVNVGMVIDSLSILFVALVSFFGLIIIIYSLGYMKGEEEGLTRYYFFLLLFIGSMIGLVISDNFLQMFIFWEMVGLCSYGLVSFWYKKDVSVNAGMKVFLMTRVGDVFLLAGILVLYVQFKTFSFAAIMTDISTTPISNYLPAITVAAFCVLGGAIAKSAQLPLHTWLVAAMEAPTSISAILHAATMVKAGVYLIARTIVIFSMFKLGTVTPVVAFIPNWLTTITWFGMLTAVLGASMAISTPDIKGVQAYSTISQLGWMIMGLGTAVSGIYSLGWYASLYQAVVHAFFQGLNFLLIGGIIHATGTRDMREMGGLRKNMRITFWLAAIYLVTIIGFPPLPSFFSKESIVTSIISTGSIALVILVYIAMAATIAYALRYFMLTFMGESSPKLEHEHVHEPPKVMLVVSAFLAGLCLVFGFFGQYFVTFMEKVSVLPVTPEVNAEVGFFAVLTSWPLTLMFALVFIGVFVLAYYFYIKKSPFMEKFVANGAVRGYNHILGQGYYFDPFYEKIVVIGVNKFSEGVYEYVENKLINRLIGGFGRVSQSAATKIKQWHTGSLRIYIAGAVAGIAIILVVLLLTILG
ncbi:MAG TPA: NADH-quinone oxidoreductase subunit L [Candidatus Lokiarchaeia archaeon]|nr:NADH-quinone oxidoreductase subunit L [Candidatus Lokiarchaeia archaeon]